MNRVKLIFYGCENITNYVGTNTNSYSFDYNLELIVAWFVSID